MLIVKSIVKSSDIAGIGLFADQTILKGASVWKFDPRFDILFDPKDVAVMEPIQKELVDTYAYLSPDSGKYVLCADNARFMNHSSVNNNVDIVKFNDETETRAVANRDIQPGEEILVNYREIDTADAKSEKDYLNR